MAESDLMYWRVHSACSPALVIFCPGLRPGACYFYPGLRANSSRRLLFLSGTACLVFPALAIFCPGLHAPEGSALGVHSPESFQRPASLNIPECEKKSVELTDYQ